MFSLLQLVLMDLKISLQALSKHSNFLVNEKSLSGLKWLEINSTPLSDVVCAYVYFSATRPHAGAHLHLSACLPSLSDFHFKLCHNPT